MHVLLLSEGNTDVRPGFQEAARGARGAIAVLLERILVELMNGDSSELRIEGGRLPRLQRGGGFDRKVKLAIELNDGKFDRLVVVIDRDGPENRNRIQLLEAGRSQASASLALRTALGVAVQELEAWLLADTAALSEVLGATGAVGEPEDISDPKAELKKLAADSDLSVGKYYDQLARAANISCIHSRCRAFERFVKEVRDRIAAN